MHSIYIIEILKNLPLVFRSLLNALHVLVSVAVRPVVELLSAINPDHIHSFVKISLYESSIPLKVVRPSHQDIFLNKNHLILICNYVINYAEIWNSSTQVYFILFF
jgi:hypothetical protein